MRSTARRPHRWQQLSDRRIGYGPAWGRRHRCGHTRSGKTATRGCGLFTVTVNPVIGDEQLGYWLCQTTTRVLTPADDTPSQRDPAIRVSCSGLSGTQYQLRVQTTPPFGVECDCLAAGIDLITTRPERRLLQRGNALATEDDRIVITELTNWLSAADERLRYVKMPARNEISPYADCHSWGVCAVSHVSVQKQPAAMWVKV